MREILYKAKRVDTGEWIQGAYVYTFKEEKNCLVVGVQVEKHWIVEPNGNMTWIDEDTLCQYTNMTDKNGQKIWENDILVAHLDENYPEDETYEQVVWHDCGFHTKNKYCDYYEELDKFTTQNFAACGNIFDDKELLEKGNMHED